MAVTRIVAAILDTKQLVLYKEDGETVEIMQGDVRVQRIIDEVTTPLSTQGWADVEIGYAEDAGNVYSDFEEKSSGVIKFFRVAKRFVQKLFNPETDAQPVAPVALGSVPVVQNVLDAKAESVPEKIKDATQNQKPDIHSAMGQIMANAKSVSDPTFNSENHDNEHDTMIAVVETPTGPAVVPGVEHLSNQMRVASKLGSTVGVERFLSRLAAVINDRGHSVQELLNFMSRGDLPIADDGSIIGYKVLRSSNEGAYNRDPSDPMPVPPTGYYVDCHSGRVLQRVGSYVTQEKVDPSRRTECSTGLHIARRAYLRGFSGDIITLVKIAPEDVIAVPHGEPDKMRARGYHIIGEIPKDEHQRLRNNQPIEGMMAKRMLGMAIKGEHIDIIEDVVIGGAYGTGLKVTPRNGHGPRTAPKITDAAPVAEALPDPEKDIKTLAAPVEAKGVAKTVETNKAATVPTHDMVPVQTRAERIKALVEMLRGKGSVDSKQAAARELKSISKTVKKSLEKLGLTAADATLVDQFLAQEPVKPLAALAPGTDAITKAKPNKTEAQPEAAKPKESKKASVSTETEQRRLYNRGEFSQLYALKKAKKKSWEALGFTPPEIKVILMNPQKK